MAITNKLTFQDLKDLEDIVAGHSKVTYQRVYNENAQISAIQAIQAINQITKRLESLN